MNHIHIKNQRTGKEITAMHARTIGELTRGLMLKKQGHMLLEFIYDARHSIWMMCMRYPLHLVFIDRNKTVTEIIENVPPLTLDPKTWKTYKPKSKARYVLEIDIRSAPDIKVGDILEF